MSSVVIMKNELISNLKTLLVSKYYFDSIIKIQPMIYIMPHNRPLIPVLVYS